LIYGILSHVVVIIHAVFILFAVFGGLLVFRWRRLAYLHLPAVLWAALVEMTGWVCPLTPLENTFRQRAGEAIYPSNFIDHYLMSWLYPEFLTAELQLALGLMVLLINVLIYMRVWQRSKKNFTLLGTAGKKSTF
jgi:hypothetical protein